MKIGVKYIENDKKLVGLLQINSITEIEKDELEILLKATYPTYYNYKILK